MCPVRYENAAVPCEEGRIVRCWSRRRRRMSAICSEWNDMICRYGRFMEKAGVVQNSYTKKNQKRGKTHDPRT